MRATITLLSVVAAAAVVQAAPPTVTLPPEVPGEVSAFVVVKAEVKGEAKGVKYVAVDPGLSVFPSDLLADKTVTVVVAAKAGRYRVLAYSGNGDGPSEPALTTVVIGGAVKPPPTDPPTDPPVTPITGKLYFAVVRPAGPLARSTADALRLSAWDELRSAGHQMRDFGTDELPAGVTAPATLPAIVTLTQNSDGKTWTVLPGSRPLPTTDAGVRDLLKK